MPAANLSVQHQADDHQGRGGRLLPLPLHQRGTVRPEVYFLPGFTTSWILQQIRALQTLCRHSLPPRPQKRVRISGLLGLWFSYVFIMLNTSRSVHCATQRSSPRTSSLTWGRSTARWRSICRTTPRSRPWLRGGQAGSTVGTGESSLLGQSGKSISPTACRY